MTRWHVIAVGAVVIVALAALMVWRAQPAAPTVPEETVPLTPEQPPHENLAPTPAPPPAVETAPPEACVPPPPVPLPPLAESDAAVAGEVTGCVGGLAPLWLAEEDLLRRAAAVVAAAAAGRVPRGQLAFMAVTGPFQTVERDGIAYLDPDSYDRYVRFVDTVTCLSPERTVALLTRFEPLLGEALGALGDTGPDARAGVDALLERVLAVPMPRGFVPLTRPNVLYEYADPSLEALDDFQKQLLRMGPANLARLQDHARAVRAELARPAPPVPEACPDA